MTRPAADVISTFGCLDALELPGSAIVTLLTRRGYTASNARNQIARLVQRGLLRSRREGRYTVYTLAPQLEHRFMRARGFTIPPPFSGSFSLLLYEVPERHRGFKDRLGYVAQLNGYGKLRSGVLIAPVDQSAAVFKTVGAPPADAWLQLSILVPPDLATARQLVARAYPVSELDAELTAVEQRLQQHLRNDQHRDTAAVRRHFALHFDAMELLFRIPNLPSDLTPNKLSARGNEVLQRLSQHYFEELRSDEMAAVAQLEATHLIRTRVEDREPSGHGPPPDYSRQQLR